MWIYSRTIPRSLSDKYPFPESRERLLLWQGKEVLEEEKLQDVRQGEEWKALLSKQKVGVEKEKVWKERLCLLQEEKGEEISASFCFSLFPNISSRALLRV